MPRKSTVTATLAATALGTLAMALACGGDQSRAKQRPEAEDRLARTYIQVLHDSGVVAVMGRTKRESAAVPAFAFGVDAMRGLLPRGPIEAIDLERWEAAHDSTNAAGATKLVYGVRGGGEAAQVEVWVERENERAVVDEIRVARRAR